MREHNAKKLSWELFEKTGNLSYYLLYKRLEDGDQDGGSRPSK
ncbi:MAG: YqzL family protein [Clostridia bacterium]|nr:YqzL family protein [Clostridia bacterium]